MPKLSKSALLLPGWICVRFVRAAALVAALLVACAATAGDPVLVGSKRFTESYLLGEIVTQRIQSIDGVHATHRQGLGNTAILFAALKSGAIDVYPEYTGTLAFELLGLARVPTLDQLNAALDSHGLAAGVAFGFSNSYALAMPAARASALGIVSIADLQRHAGATGLPGLRYGLSQEFIHRKDGWPGLRDAYALSARPLGLDHGVAYEAVKAGTVDVIDVYTTDAKLERYALKVLTDDRGYFPPYDALLVYRKDLPQRHPAAFRALQTLTNGISGTAMIRMNAAAELDGQPFARIAEAFLAGSTSTAIESSARPGWLARLFAPDFWRLTAEHCLLVFGALLLSVAAGLPLGVWAARSRRARPWILGVTGMLQTIPALALLAFLIAALGRIGMVPAVIALFLYGLLPIVRNAESGLAGVAPGVSKAGLALGLRPRAVMRLIELPLALPSVLAGIKISAVINVGTATIAAFIGAGGYGERIVAGLAVNDHAMMLAGAVPAAVLALLIQWVFERAEMHFLPFLHYGLEDRLAERSRSRT